ncbi:MAG: hypothetical protein GY811_14120 [Myxococcales bacterium]|nr:hypothetical protein [Myxococcales bacterium]
MKDPRKQRDRSTENVGLPPAQTGSGSYSLSHGSTSIDGPADVSLHHVDGGEEQARMGEPDGRESADSSDVTSSGSMMHNMRSSVGPGAISEIGERLQKQKASALAHERRVARLLGGKLVPGSGSLGQPGDIRTEKFLISCKETSQTTFRVIEEIKKATAEAASEELMPAIVFHFTALPAHSERDWALVPLRVMASLDWQAAPPRRTTS